LPVALRHYTEELESIFQQAGIVCSSLRLEAVEMGASGTSGKAALLRRALENRRRVSACQDPVLQVWPSFGLLDVRLLARKSVRTGVIIHDPVPLRQQIGYDRCSARVAERGSLHAEILVHSRDAQASVAEQVPGLRCRRFLHPIGNAREVASAPQDRLVVLVAGQYKPARDLNLLRKLGVVLSRAGVEARIVGRGWPEEMEGWSIRSEFVSEEELDRELGGATLVLIPYSRYFQSGVAVRALELGTVPISPRTSFFEDLMGAKSPAIFESLDLDAVLEAISNVTRASLDARQLRDDYAARAVASAQHCFADWMNG
jgi:hypothetical protein